MGLVLFVNTVQEMCGVHQYGRALYNCLKGDGNHEFQYVTPCDREMLDLIVWGHTPDAIIYNWHPLIGGFLDAGKPNIPCKQVIIYHDHWAKANEFDAVILSDPTQGNLGKWYYIGRPIPKWQVVERKYEFPITLGLHGFNGGWSIYTVKKICEEFEHARIRLHLPASPFVDPEGIHAKLIAAECQNEIKGHPGITVEIHHTFLRDMNQLLAWLSQNDMNVYIRDKVPWVGVSSALDAALAVGRPIAINACQAFRHLFCAKPSIMVEDRSLVDIFNSGTEPLKPFLEEWSATEIRHEVESVIDAIL